MADGWDVVASEEGKTPCQLKYEAARQEVCRLVIQSAKSAQALRQLKASEVTQEDRQRMGEQLVELYRLEQQAREECEKCRQGYVAELPASKQRRDSNGSSDSGNFLESIFGTEKKPAEEKPRPVGRQMALIPELAGKGNDYPFFPVAYRSPLA